MYTWICPQCGREVPPSSTDCPDCAGKARTRTAEESFEPAQASVEPAGARTPRRAGPPAWLLACVFAIVFLTVGSVGFLAYRFLAHRGEPLVTWPVNPVRTPQTGTPVSATPTASVLNKYIEVTGLRLLESKADRLEVEFVIVNHSGAPLIDVAGTVTIRPTTAKPDGEAVGSFAFRLPEMRPYEARSLRAPLQSKLRVYELPDWQFIRADVTITSPQVDP